jgi:hypothetical protein
MILKMTTLLAIAGVTSCATISSAVTLVNGSCEDINSKYFNPGTPGTYEGLGNDGGWDGHVRLAEAFAPD